ncbi:MAG: mechanosensitive ion channel family protein [Rhodothermales bacterium]|nr:mechanosensitive ion channel family protein [Rhodothermales bacterium]MBO6781150.1 mechanosensitive ion channel family protein [Rhodothermales bacterium]
MQDPNASTQEVVDATQTVLDKLTGWLESAIALLPNFVVALLVVVLFTIIAKILRRFLGKALHRTIDNQQVARLLNSVVYTAVITIGAFVALSVLQLDGAVTKLLAGVGILGLALGFAFQDIAANFVSGVLLAVRRPFKEGNIIETSGITGRVTEVNLRSTIIEQFDGQKVYVPNAQVFGNPITNLYDGGDRRIDLPCGVSYDDDLELARKVALEAVSKVPGRDENRDPDFVFTSFGGSSIDFVVVFWILSADDHAKYLHARSNAIMLLKKAFDQAGLNIPFPIRTLDAGDSLKELFAGRA